MDPKLRYLIITVVLGIVIFVVYHFMFYTKWQSQIRTLEKKAEELRTELTRARIAANKLPQLEIEIKKLEYLWAKARKLLPEKEKPEEIINIIQQRAMENGIKIKDIKRGAPVSKGDYTEHPYSLEVQGNFHDFVMFLTDLPTLSRIVTVKNLKLTGSKDTREKYSLKVSFTASFYTSPIGQAKPLKKTETKGGKKK